MDLGDKTLIRGANPIKRVGQKSVMSTEITLRECAMRVDCNVHVAMWYHVDFCIERATREGEEKTKEKVAGVGAGGGGKEEGIPKHPERNAYPR